MDVAAKVEPDASLAVTERIAFVAEHVDIRRGLIRDIPIMHRDERGRKVWADFKMLSATLDGKPVHFETKRSGFFMEIHLGDDQFLSKGRHEYVIRYAMTKQLIFHDDGDELYWNVTGNNWDFPIEKAVFRVTLPPGAAIFEHDAAMGRAGSAEKSWRRNPDGSFAVSRPLARREGFTVSVTWPKGFVTEPPKPWLDVFMDRYGKSLYVFFCLSVVLWYAGWWWRIGKDPKRGLIIPLFEAPYGFEPGYAGYVKTLNFDASQFTADLVDLAVRGYLVLAPEGDIVTAVRTQKEWDGGLSAAHRALLQALFQNGRTKAQLGGGGGNGSSVTSTFTQGMIRTMSRIYGVGGYAKKAGKPVLRKWNVLPCLAGLLFYIPILWLLFFLDSGIFVMIVILFGSLFPLGAAGAAIGVTVAGSLRQISSTGMSFGNTWPIVFSIFFVTVFCLIFFGFFFSLILPDLIGRLDMSFFLPGIAALAATIVFSLLMPARTKTRREYLDQVEGFELYLKTAEKNRLEVLYPLVKGKVPEPTRETFERFLPYAFALGVA